VPPPLTVKLLTPGYAIEACCTLQDKQLQILCERDDHQLIKVNNAG
jgi:hypothetical protein